MMTPIILITQHETTDELGDVKIEEHKRKVLANKLSIGAKEHYQAQAIGMRPELKVQIRNFEYKNETLLVENNTRYNVMRTFDVGNGTIELTCSKGINNGSA